MPFAMKMTLWQLSEAMNLSSRAFNHENQSLQSFRAQIMGETTISALSCTLWKQVRLSLRFCLPLLGREIDGLTLGTNHERIWVINKIELDSKFSHLLKNDLLDHCFLFLLLKNYIVSEKRQPDLNHKW
jgi:hypothetical protein